jgi:thioredoxin-like negative regulator of GroEL
VHDDQPFRDGERPSLALGLSQLQRKMGYPADPWQDESWIVAAQGFYDVLARAEMVEELRKWTPGAPKSKRPVLDAGLSPALNGLVGETTTQGFKSDVIMHSKHQPVLVEFWANWCGPCRILSPVLERLVLRVGGGEVKLINWILTAIRRWQGSLGIKSIPTVFAFTDGQPVDGFIGAQPESRVLELIDRIPNVESEAKLLAAVG